VQAWQLIVSVIGHHILPALLACAAIHLALCFLFGPGRLRRPADRVLFLYAALLKAALAVWAGEAISCFRADSKRPIIAGYFVLRLPDVVPNGPPFEPRVLAAILARSELAGLMFLAIIILGLALLCLRWIRLAPFCRRIYEFRRAETGEFTHLFRIFDELVSRSYGEGVRVARPRLLVIRDAPCPAFTMGIRPPVIVLSAELVAQLGARELRGILAHELGHVRRLDYVGRWLATVLRDLMIWNPFALWWYHRLLEEQERACDESAAALVNDPAAVMRGLVEVAAHAIRLPVVAPGPLTAWRRDRDLLTLKERLGRLEHNFGRPPGASMWPRLLLFPVLVAFLMIQPHATLCFRNLYAALSRAL